MPGTVPRRAGGAHDRERAASISSPMWTRSVPGDSSSHIKAHSGALTATRRGPGRRPATHLVDAGVRNPVRDPLPGDRHRNPRPHEDPDFKDDRVGPGLRDETAPHRANNRELTQNSVCGTLPGRGADQALRLCHRAGKSRRGPRTRRGGERGRSPCRDPLRATTQRVAGRGTSSTPYVVDDVTQPSMAARAGGDSAPRPTRTSP